MIVGRFQPPLVQIRNRQLLAERYGYPEGVLAACIEVERDYPRWRVHWSRGGEHYYPKPGFYGVARIPNGASHRVFDTCGETIEQLRDHLEIADDWLPPKPNNYSQLGRIGVRDRSPAVS